MTCARERHGRLRARVCVCVCSNLRALGDPHRRRPLERYARHTQVLETRGRRRDVRGLPSLSCRARQDWLGTPYIGFLAEVHTGSSWEIRAVSSNFQPTLQAPPTPRSGLGGAGGLRAPPLRSRPPAEPSNRRGPSCRGSARSASCSWRAPRGASWRGGRARRGRRAPPCARRRSRAPQRRRRSAGRRRPRRAPPSAAATSTPCPRPSHRSSECRGWSPAMTWGLPRDEGHRLATHPLRTSGGQLWGSWVLRAVRAGVGAMGTESPNI